MADKVQKISITVCPVCGKSHTFDLSIEPIGVIKFIVPVEPPAPVTVTFTCLEKNQDFEATLRLPGRLVHPPTAGGLTLPPPARRREP